MAGRKSTKTPVLTERMGPLEIERQSRLFEDGTLLGLLPDAMPCILMVVNRHGQIVLANRRLKEILSPRQRKIGILGRRPGEVLGCAHARENEYGCGTTEFCTTCGAAGAILSGLYGTADVRECRILREKNAGVLDLRVWTTPLLVEREPFTICAALDISDEKRRQVLERIFLHDIYNVAYGLSWYADFFPNAEPSKIEEYADAIRRLSHELIDEIDGQRILLKAESGELVSKPEEINSGQLLQGTVELYRRHPASHDRALRIDERVHEVVLTTDRTLLARALSNLVKNALEACRAGETVTVGCTTSNGTAEFWVHNPGCMPHDVQLQIFQRSFSTKGRGRGLGAYSVKLLTERYLRGTASFTSTTETGTTFRIHCPLAPRDRKPQSGPEAAP